MKTTSQGQLRQVTKSTCNVRPHGFLPTSVSCVQTPGPLSVPGPCSESPSRACRLQDVHVWAVLRRGSVRRVRGSPGAAAHSCSPTRPGRGLPRTRLQAPGTPGRPETQRGFLAPCPAAVLPFPGSVSTFQVPDRCFLRGRKRTLASPSPGKQRQPSPGVSCPLTLVLGVDHGRWPPGPWQPTRDPQS